jgi:hypothetical protein
LGFFVDPQPDLINTGVGAATPITYLAEILSMAKAKKERQAFMAKKIARR